MNERDDGNKHQVKQRIGGGNNILWVVLIGKTEMLSCPFLDDSPTCPALWSLGPPLSACPASWKCPFPNLLLTLLFILKRSNYALLLVLSPPFKFNLFTSNFRKFNYPFKNTKIFKLRLPIFKFNKCLLMGLWKSTLIF